jgi:PAS domain S-box-containing protein
VVGKQAFSRLRTPRSLAWNAQVAQLASYLQHSTAAVACCIAATDHGRLNPLGSVGEPFDTLFFRDIIAQLPALPRFEEELVVPSGTLQVVAIAIGGEQAEGCVLLVFDGDIPPAASLRAAVALLAQALRDGQQAYALRHHALWLERQQAVRMHEIKNSRNYLRGIIDNIAVGLVLVDADGTVRAINSTLAQRFGREPAELVGRHYAVALGDWQRSSAAQTLSDGSAAARTIELNQPDQTRALIAISSFPLGDTHGRIQRAVEVWEDITQQAALQNQLIRAEKLAAIGQLAASVAHEVGNPLQAIQGFISLFLESCPEEVPNRYYLQVAEQEIERVARVVARLRDFYRPSSDVLAPVQVNELLEDVLLLVSKQLQHSRIALVRQLQPDLPAILGVADQLKQVILNLVLNAAEAMPEGGKLVISTLAHSGQRGYASAIEAVEIAIADSGFGIPPERIAHLFDGLQTTKARGMGLGLYTSKAIIDRHMGRILVESSPGTGTTFRIVLPVAEKESKP